MYIERNLEETILKYLNAKEIIAIVGPRQCGKTTMAKHLMEGLPGAISISFDDQKILNLFEKSTDDFIASYVKGYKYLFIDEFQYAKSGGRVLKFIYDSQKIKIIISGSSAIDLSVQAVKFLVGRIVIFNLQPFDFSEFLAARDINYLKIYKEYKSLFSFNQKTEIKINDISHEKLFQYYEEYLIYGGYPRVVLEENYDLKKDLLKNIYNTYFLREVRDILGLISNYKLDKLLKGLALQIGNLIQYEELSRLSEYSYPSLKKYLSFLAKTYVCKLIQPFYKNKRIEIVKNPKVYFFDTGLRNSIAGDFRKLTERGDGGALLENALAMEFLKKGLEFNYWRDKKKNEIDFIVNLGEGKQVAIEVKSHLKREAAPAMRIFKKLYPSIEIFYAYQSLDKKIRIIPGANPIYLY